MPGLVIQGLSKRLGGRLVVDDLSLSVGSGELVCLLGPSGCGKTTTLRMIGGFVQPDGGSIAIGGQEVTELPPERRPTAMVFQSYALWPHMTVLKNIAFGLRLRKMAKAEIAERVDAVLAIVNLGHVRDRHPAQLSGGEQQRVALARAIVLEPELLLLDEPLSNLDAKLRVGVREEIREIQQRLQIATVFVTHDQDEALSVSDRIAVMSGGKIEQVADADGLYRRPATSFVAGFVGAMNFFTGRLLAGGVQLAEGAPPVPCGEVPAELVGTTFELAVRPEDVEVLDDWSEGSGQASPATLRKEIPHGHFKEVVLGLPGELQVRSFVAPQFDASRPLGVRFSRLLLYRDGALAHELDAARTTATPLR